MAEKFISGGPANPEFTCAILGRRALPTVRIEPDGEFYDYRAKYVSNDTRYACPSGLPDALEARVRELCAKAFELLGARVIVTGVSAEIARTLLPIDAELGTLVTRSTLRSGFAHAYTQCRRL